MIILGTPLNDDIATYLPTSDVYYLYGGDDKAWAWGGDDTLYGDTGNDTLDGDDGNDDLFGEAGNDDLDGYDGNDELYGGAGADSLSGDSGVDTLGGGDGNDRYYLGSGDESDHLYESETASGGVDVVHSFISWTLGAYFEHLTLGETYAGINGQGNGLDNTIYGNGMPNILRGLDGNDFLSGFGGNDSLEGGNGNDTLNGDAGSDSLIGGAGNDRYYVDSAADAVHEYSGEGIDTVRAYVSWTLAVSPYVENLVLEGAEAINGTGNVLDNVLTGNAANNTLDGGAGNDSMAGGAGDDAYNVDSAGDKVTEALGAGDDRIWSTATFSLPDNVERLYLEGGAAIHGYGNALQNIMEGNVASNNLAGGDGNDDLFGDSGNDSMSGGIGDDTLSGGAGTDSLSGEAGNDYLHGASDSDTLEGGTGNDTLYGSLIGGLDVDTASYASAAAGVKASLTLGEATGGAGNDALYRIENLIGSAFDDGLVGSAGGNALQGGLGNDTLYGEGGSDMLDGGAGNDLLVGGPGDDRYSVESASDGVTEALDEGNDLVWSWVTFTLPANVERLYLEGGAVTNGYGNDLSNIVEGNGAANLLAGGNGDDSLYGDAGDDILNGEGGTDTLNGGTGNDVLNGGTGDDSLAGGDGGDLFYGGGGANTMAGGTGNDAYNVESTGNTVTEAPGEGDDRIWSWVTFSLPDGVERLYLEGGAVTSGYGNALPNIMEGNGAANELAGGDGNDSLFGDAGSDTIRGEAGQDTLDGGSSNDVLNGGAGADAMAGGSGDDVYWVTSTGDKVTELTGEGADLVNSSVGHTLKANVENLRLTGTAATSGTGNILDNTLTGNTGSNVLTGWGGSDSLLGLAGDDTLLGKTGNDVLTGGLGMDVFRFDTRLDAGTNVDTIKGFVVADDTVELENGVFLALTATGTLDPAAFWKGPAVSAAHDTDDRIVYDTDTGALYYDRDGLGGVAPIQFAVVNGSPNGVTADDFVVT
jgi:Ca2+-binding RTX toxin-like protein